MVIIKKQIKFDLVINNIKINTIEDIRDSADENLIDLYCSGRLLKWLKNNDYSDYAAKVEQLNSKLSKKDIFSALVAIFDIDIDVNLWPIDAEEQFSMGLAYYVQKNNERAIFWVSKAAEQGHSEAQSFLGGLYLTGDCVPIDKNQALFWVTKSAEQGNKGAQCVLGCMFDDGDGVAEDKKQAFYWYKKAADNGDADAQFRLGVMYYYGEGVSIDKQEAYSWLNKSSKNGNEDAKHKLESLYYTVK